MVNWRKVKEVSSACRWASVHRQTTWLRWRDNNCMLPAPVCLFIRGRRKSSQKLVKQITLVSFSTLSLPPDMNGNRKTGFNVPSRKGSVDLIWFDFYWACRKAGALWSWFSRAKQQTVEKMENHKPRTRSLEGKLMGKVRITVSNVREGCLDQACLSLELLFLQQRGGVQRA